MECRPVLENDIADVAASLADAFVDNPTYRYVIGNGPWLRMDLALYLAAHLQACVAAAPAAGAVCTIDRRAALLSATKRCHAPTSTRAVH